MRGLSGRHRPSASLPGTPASCGLYAIRSCLAIFLLEGARRRTLFVLDPCTRRTSVRSLDILPTNRRPNASLPHHAFMTKHMSQAHFHLTSVKHPQGRRHSFTSGLHGACEVTNYSPSLQRLDVVVRRARIVSQTHGALPHVEAIAGSKSKARRNCLVHWWQVRVRSGRSSAVRLGLLVLW